MPKDSHVQSSKSTIDDKPEASRLRGIICAWSDGDSSEGDVAIAYTAALGLNPETCRSISEQIEEDPAELGIAPGDNWILCHGLIIGDSEEPGYLDLSRIEPELARAFALSVIDSIAEYWSSEEAFEPSGDGAS